MSVVATPFLLVDEQSALSVVAPDVTHVEGVPSFGRKQTARVNQGQYTTLRWQIRDRVTGRVIDLSFDGSGSGSGGSGGGSNSGSSSSSSSSPGSSSSLTPTGDVRRVQFRATEAICRNVELQWATEAAVVSAEDGVVEVVLPTAMTDVSGVYSVEFGVFAGTDPGTADARSTQRLSYSVQGYVWVNRGQFGRGPTNYGLPSIDDLRTLLIDSGPEDNYLTAVTEFDATEYAQAAVQSVIRYNQRPPAISALGRDTTNFPDSAALTDCVLAELYRMAAAGYRRNHLPYQAAGVSVDDKNKADQYERMSMALFEQFDRWAAVVKKGQNAGRWNGTLLSPYSYPGGNYYVG